MPHFALPSLHRVSLLVLACLATACQDDAPPIGPNSVVATASPSGDIETVAGEGSQTVRVTFNTTDGLPATDLVVSGLDSLPEGWSSEGAEFGCDELANGTICQLSLSYEPQSADSGTLTLDYDYLDGEGTAKSGDVSISYAATTDNNVVGTAAPSGEIAVPVGDESSVTVTFTTDDGAPASGFTVTSDLSALPAGWSSTPDSLECDAVAADDACQLTLNYAPTGPDSGTLSLAFGYTSNSGTEKTGSIDIPYRAKGPKLYAGHFGGEPHYCAIGDDGLVNDCTPTTGLNGATGVVFHGDFAYVADYFNNDVKVCDVVADGSLANCASTGSELYGPFVLAVNGNYLYAANAQGGHTITYCAIQGDGSLANCAETTTLETVEGIAFANGYAYISQPHTNIVNVCAVHPTDGSLAACAVTGSGFAGPESIALADGYLFVGNTISASVSTCAVNASNGTLSGCFTSPVDNGPMGMALHEGRAYVSTRNGLIYVCDVNNAGALSNCVVSNGGATFGLMIQLTVR